MERHKIELNSPTHITTTLGVEGNIFIDGYPIKVIANCVVYKGKFWGTTAYNVTWRLNFDNKLITKHPDYPIIRLQIIELLKLPSGLESAKKRLGNAI